MCGVEGGRGVEDIERDQGFGYEEERVLPAVKGCFWVGVLTFNLLHYIGNADEGYRRYVLDQILSREATEIMVEQIHEYMTNMAESIRGGKEKIDDFSIFKVCFFFPSRIIRSFLHYHSDSVNIARITPNWKGSRTLPWR
jgi:hypothetical protein